MMKRIISIFMALFLLAVAGEAKIKKITFPNGDCYEGEVKKDVPNGQGTMQYSNGARHVGSWTNGERSGNGQYTFKDNSGCLRLIDGIWEKNILQQGRILYDNPSIHMSYRLNPDGVSFSGKAEYVLNGNTTGFAEGTWKPAKVEDVLVNDVKLVDGNSEKFPFDGILFSGTWKDEKFIKGKVEGKRISKSKGTLLLDGVVDNELYTGKYVVSQESEGHMELNINGRNTAKGTIAVSTGSNYSGDLYVSLKNDFFPKSIYPDLNGTANLVTKQSRLFVDAQWKDQIVNKVNSAFYVRHETTDTIRLTTDLLYGMTFNNLVYVNHFLDTASVAMRLSYSIITEAPNSVKVGQEFDLTYNINRSDVESIRIDDIPETFEIIEQPSFTQPKGSAVYEGTKSFHYRLKAKKPGIAFIPVVHATIGGINFSSRPKKIDILKNTITANFKVGEEYYYNFWYEIGATGRFNSVRKYKVVSKDPNGYTIELSYLANHKDSYHKDFTADLMTTIFNSLVGTKLIFKTDKNGHLIKLTNASQVQINAMRKITAAIGKMAADYPVLQNQQQRENILDNIRKMLTEKYFINPESPENLLFSLYGKEVKLDNSETYYAEPRWAYLAGFSFKRSRQYKLSTDKGDTKFEITSQIDMSHSERKQMVLNAFAASNPQNPDYVRKVKDNIDVFLQNNGIANYKEDVETTLYLNNNGWIRFAVDNRPYEPQKHQTTVIRLIEQKDLNLYLSGRMR